MAMNIWQMMFWVGQKYDGHKQKGKLVRQDIKN